MENSLLVIFDEIWLMTLYYSTGSLARFLSNLKNCKKSNFDQNQLKLSTQLEKISSTVVYLSYNTCTCSTVVYLSYNTCTCSTVVYLSYNTCTCSTVVYLSYNTCTCSTVVYLHMHS